MLTYHNVQFLPPQPPPRPQLVVFMHYNYGNNSNYNLLFQVGCFFFDMYLHIFFLVITFYICTFAEQNTTEEQSLKILFNNKRQPRNGEGTGNCPNSFLGVFCTPKVRLSCIFIFSNMQKENQTQAKPSQDVMVAVAQFVSDANYEFDLATLPGEIEEINNLFMDTDYADTIETRRKMLRCKKFILDFCQVVDVDVLVQIENFSKHHGNV